MLTIQYLQINLVHEYEISIKVGQVDVHFNNVLKARSRRFEDFGHILDGYTLDRDSIIVMACLI